jgi:hypothetical protein
MIPLEILKKLFYICRIETVIFNENFQQYNIKQQNGFN